MLEKYLYPIDEDKAEQVTKWLRFIHSSI
jgi:hypothetical protein